MIQQVLDRPTKIAQNLLRQIIRKVTTSCDKTDRTAQAATFELLRRAAHDLILRSAWSHLARGKAPFRDILRLTEIKPDRNAADASRLRRHANLIWLVLTPRANAVLYVRGQLSRAE
jgi:hypothetical protein